MYDSVLLETLLLPMYPIIEESHSIGQKSLREEFKIL